MKRLLVGLDDERYEDLRRLAFDKNAAMAELVRYAIEKVYEDQLDVVAIKRGLEEHAKNPSGTITIEELMEQMGIELPRRARSKRAAPTQKAAS